MGAPFFSEPYFGFALPAAGDKLVRPEDVLGPEVPGPQAVDAVEQSWGLPHRERGLGERGPDVATQGIRAGQGLVGPLEDDDVPLPREGLDDRGLGEGADDVQVNGAHLRAPGGPEVVHRRLDVLGGGAEGDEHGVRVLRLVPGEEAVVAAGQPPELGMGLLEELEDGLGEVVPPGDHALHVVLLCLVLGRRRPRQDHQQAEDASRGNKPPHSDASLLAVWIYSGYSRSMFFRLPE